MENKPFHPIMDLDEAIRTFSAMTGLHVEKTESSRFIGVGTIAYSRPDKDVEIMRLEFRFDSARGWYVGSWSNTFNPANFFGEFCLTFPQPCDIVQ